MTKQTIGLQNALEKGAIMDIFEKGEEFTGLELKRAAEFGKGGEKNFDGMITELQMETYLVIRDFRRKRNKKGAEYGMPVCVYAKPEALWGYEMVAAAYKEEPETSGKRILEHMRELYPDAEEKEIKKVVL